MRTSYIRPRLSEPDCRGRWVGLRSAPPAARRLLQVIAVLFIFVPLTDGWAEEAAKSEKLSEEESWVIHQLMKGGVIEGEDAWKIYEILKQKEQALGPYRCDWVRTNFVQVGQEALDQPGATKKIINTNKTKVWRKGDHRRLESQNREGQREIHIGHPDGFTYTYDATEDVYVKQHRHEGLREFFSEEEIAGFSRKEGKDIRILGTDIIGGGEAAVMELVDRDSGGSAKIWVSTSTGLDFRMEMPCPPSQDLPDLRCKTVLEWTNFILEDIPDSVFEVPKDKIVEAVQNEP